VQDLVISNLTNRSIREEPQGPKETRNKRNKERRRKL
jgi:hypothetical protein